MDHRARSEQDDEGGLHRGDCSGHAREHKLQTGKHTKRASVEADAVTHDMATK